MYGDRGEKFSRDIMAIPATVKQVSRIFLCMQLWKE
ncbi:hypothetical protein OOU_Y34scaffold00463g6 [Pyricularia oryzae Y34]|uniref:Uncharacterized protein n=2 Tax=Pyricularia oryzae TaxID=318829 RepID=A0AA97P135_PYRO3|nr:hypothetical protein OOU_Y34scaffold00463g6 [Pyricularia oryzae Y34]